MKYSYENEEDVRSELDLLKAKNKKLIKAISISNKRLLNDKTKN